MKRLLLLRHAQALPANGGQDFDRALSPKGLEDARALGQALRQRGLIPDYILCSSAKRTQQTCKESLFQTDEHKIHSSFSKDIYSASRGDLFHLIQNVRDNPATLMLIGHNPAIYELAVMLAAAGNDAVLARLSNGYQPASLSIIEAPIDDWAALDPDKCQIVDLLDPLDYNAPARPTRWT
ncbi:MAG TPA: histidine phosphatase family protein [Alphaproteobacteria bacterium]|nr:histidine phosphatase family protein [Alphaproteobacteria bacterium]USO04887.1 MAG: histidine phosphatase family protein [Rhodospirillales bacterium]HOO82775.1 histidine phosphatase family protein [Alphaproteobacteria bacterium]